MYAGGLADLVIATHIDSLTAGDQARVYRNARTRTAMMPLLPQSGAILDPALATKADRASEDKRLTPSQTLLLDAILGEEADTKGMASFVSPRKVAKKIVDYVADPANRQGMTGEMEALADGLRRSLLSPGLGGGAGSVTRTISARSTAIMKAHRAAVEAMRSLKQGDEDVAQDLTALGVIGARRSLDLDDCPRGPFHEFVAPGRGLSGDLR